MYHLQTIYAWRRQKKATTTVPYLCGSFKLIAKNFVHLIEVFVFTYFFSFHLISALTLQSDLRQREKTTNKTSVCHSCFGEAEKKCICATS